MKKLIASILAASVTLSSAAICAGAQGRTIDINEALTNKSEIHILYNDSVVKYEDVKPVNTDGRVMIPFRAALENMGATVDYDDTERKVTAKKGDITISFVLMDDTIYIDNNGEQSTITMDVPMIIVQDRTLVPIRFMSNALGMQVGWDGDTETVVIMDYDDYFSNFGEIMPNLAKLSELSSQSAYNKGSLNFEYSVDGKGLFEVASFGISGKAEAKAAGTTASADIIFDIDSDSVTVSDASLSTVIDKTSVYVKTNLLKKLAAVSDNAELKAASLLVDDDAWYSVDIAALLVALGIDENTINVFETAINAGGSMDIEDALMAMVQTEGDADFNKVMTLASMLDVYEAMDKYIKLETKENGGYTAEIDMNAGDFVEIMNASLGSMMTDEDKQQMLDLISCTFKATVEADDTKQDVNAVFTMNSPYIEMNLKLGETAEKTAKEEEIAVPEASTDITDTVIKFLTGKQN